MNENLNMGKYSVLYPDFKKQDYKTMSDETCHDLGLDTLCKELSQDETEQRLIYSMMANIPVNPYTVKFRIDVFDDIYKNPDFRKKIMELLEKIKFLQDFGGFGGNYDEGSGIWDLVHKLYEINDYIICVETMYECLSLSGLKSEGLKMLKENINTIYRDNAFDALKKDIEGLNATARNLKSITVGINLDERFEACGVGLISVNDKYFTKSNVLKNFYDKISQSDSVSSDTEKNPPLKFYPATNKQKAGFEQGFARLSNPLYALTMARINESNGAKNMPQSVDAAASSLLNTTAKKLKSTLSKYVMVSVKDITDLAVEFMYYIRWAEYIEKLEQKNMNFSKASVSDKVRYMQAEGIYNLKLANSLSDGNEIVKNSLTFDNEKCIYILTGANRGGKTTITQAIGIAFMLAQGGIYVPCDSFDFAPVDCIYTHFPADEDKTMDLGRLGEECKRFRAVFSECTSKSLVLLNETFSTTSFEEGYYIAKDSVKALLSKSVRTIYNTHMYKLAFDVNEINSGADEAKAFSLIVKAEGGNRSFKIEVAPPEGMSYAMDIAKKYGVTYEMLTKTEKEG